MSYKEEFANNNADLQTILDTINDLETGSNVSYDTCNVNIGIDNYIQGYITRYYYSKAAEGMVEFIDVTPTTDIYDITLTDVLCGSSIGFEISCASITVSVSGGCETLLYSGANPTLVVKAPTTAGATGTARLVAD